MYGHLPADKHFPSMSAALRAGKQKKLQKKGITLAQTRTKI